MVERDRTQKEIVDIRVREEVEFPQNPEARFEAVFSTIGNSEAKCLTLLCLGQAPLAPAELHQRFLIESEGIWKTSFTLQAIYCLATLIPIGLVAEADTLYYGSLEYITGFRLTQAGQKYGQPIAAFLLEKSTQLPYSLLEIFGKTGSVGKTRSVTNRARILELLSENSSPQRRTDITRSLGLHPSIGNHLQHLARLGLIQYSSISVKEKGWAKYTLLPSAQRGKVQTVNEYRQLTHIVANLLFELGTIDVDSLGEKLAVQLPGRNMAYLKKQSSKILSGLVKQGICMSELFVGRKIQSQTQITSAGNDLVTQVIRPIKRALTDNGSLLAVWQRIPWQNYAKQAILKHKEASSHVQPHSFEENIEEVSLIISQNPGIRQRDIQTLLGRTPTNLIKILLDQGKIHKERKGKAIRYYLSS